MHIKEKKVSALIHNLIGDAEVSTIFDLKVIKS
jgi:hypothetical protein